MKQNALLIFLKFPQEGMVKTRLAEDIGQDKALKVYRILVEATLNAAGDETGYDRFIFYTPEIGEDRIKRWLGSKYKVLPQATGNLGERLTAAFKVAFTKGAKRVVAIGSDCLFVDRELIKSAFSMLKKKDVVIGPSLDGGYYLIGTSHFFKSLFCDIDWGSSNVLEQTKDRIKRRAVILGTLPHHYDIDTLADLKRLREDIKRGRIKADRTLKQICKIVET